MLCGLDYIVLGEVTRKVMGKKFFGIIIDFIKKNTVTFNLNSKTYIVGSYVEALARVMQSSKMMDIFWYTYPNNETYDSIQIT